MIKIDSDVGEDRRIVVKWTVDWQDDDEIAEVQRAGGYDGRLQSRASTAPAAPARQEHLRRALRRP